jgi:SAM-dependent methyltransferase
MGVLLVDAHGLSAPSDWIQRWGHLVPSAARVLDVACGSGRHMAWFAALGCAVTGIDRSADALRAAGQYGTALQADIENGPWPLMTAEQPQQFEVIVVTNYLWRPLFPTMLQSLAPGGLLLFETFTSGNETVGKPSRPDFLLQPGELLERCQGLQIIAFEEGFLPDPERFVQRIAAFKPDETTDRMQPPARRLLSLK